MRGKAFLTAWVVSALLLGSCSEASPDVAAESRDLTADEMASLSSLEEVDDYPLYVMHRYAPEPLLAESADMAFAAVAHSPGWGCALFAAVADPDSMVFGRNFDWEFSPALLLFNHPEEGYESVAMVDIEYLGYPGGAARDLADKALGDLVGLLDAPRIPFDGMNEAGLVIGMAAVPATPVPFDASRETVDSLGVIRVALDTAATVDEAVEVFRSLNVDFSGQTPLHYLLADATGDAAVLEYRAGEVWVARSDTGWLHATNFLLSHDEEAAGQCDRYDKLDAELASLRGELDLDMALRLLEDVAQSHTQWSIAYGLSTGELRVTMGQAYGTTYDFVLSNGG
ncbi:MAG: linear amide C-N hydrolase [Acidimicrobiia bacterium]|nr:linear amide C-N hydrolase [Acidimicrobiia bacterium]